MLDNTCIRAIAEGDFVAFRSLYDVMSSRMFYYLYKLIRDKEVCEDLVQETFVLYWKNRADFKELLPVKIYLFATLKNLARNHLRVELNRKRILDSLEWEDVIFDDHLLITTELCGEVKQAVAELPRQVRQVIELSMADMTVNGIAEELQMSPNTVKSLKKTGYKLLRERLAHLRFLLHFLLIS